MEKISIIITHWAMSPERSEVMRKSLESVIETTRHLPVEIIVVDNGGSLEDSQYLLGLCQEKKIQFYVRNSENLYFGFGRNQGIDIACGDFLVFSDNDILYKPGWLDKCINILNKLPADKLIMVTPLRTDRMHRQDKFWSGTVNVDGEELLMNMRAGSNSWIMRKNMFWLVGKFRNHRIAGSKWNDEAVRKGFHVVTMESNSLAEDIGFKKGYDLQKDVEIKRKFSNGEELIIND